MWPFKNKFQKLKREDVVDAIVKLEKESNSIDEQIVSSKAEIDKWMEMGRKEQDRQMKLFYAKKVNNAKAERERNIQRAMYVMYNINLLEKLKRAIDDNTFFAKTGNISLNQLLGDQKGLATFLNNALNTRVAAEDILTSADDTFKEVEMAYTPNETIYGIGKEDDALLAMFEDQAQLDSEAFATSEVASASAPTSDTTPIE